MFHWMRFRILRVGKELRQAAAETSLSPHVRPPSTDMRSPCRTAPYVQDPGGTARICTLVATERARARWARNEPWDSHPVCDADRAPSTRRPRTVALLPASQSVPGVSTLSPNPYPPNPRADRVVRCMSLIADELTAALHAALAAAGLPEPKKVEVAPTNNREHGDFQSNVALGLQKQVGARGTEIAQQIVRALEQAPPPHVERIEVAGPGFLNFFLSPTWLHDVLTTVVAAGDEYGRGDTYQGQRVNLEFVSVNPTGPLHAGGGRWVAVGDAIANLLAAQGADRASRVLPERRGQPARNVRCIAVRAVHGRAAAGRRLPGRVPRRDGGAVAGGAGRRRDRGGGPGMGPPRRGRAARGRPRPHRRALRHLVLRAHPARGGQGRPGARAPRDRRRHLRERRRDVAAGRGSRRSARPGPREVGRQHDVPAATTSPTTWTRSSAGGSTSSTSGARTITAR